MYVVKATFCTFINVFDIFVGFFFRLRSTGELYLVKFDFDWTACTDFFDFDTDMHPAGLADGVARESWSREFFNTLQKYVVFIYQLSISD